MVLKLYSVYDRKTEIYHPFYMCHNDGHAGRVLSDVFSNQNSNYYRHPEDFQVYECGTFNDTTAEIKPRSKPRFLCHGTQLKEGLKNGNNHHKKEERIPESPEETGSEK